MSAIGQLYTPAKTISRIRAAFGEHTHTPTAHLSALVIPHIAPASSASDGSDLVGSGTAGASKNIENPQDRIQVNFGDCSHPGKDLNIYSSRRV